MFFSWFNTKPFQLSILLVILFNIFLITSSGLDLIDQSLNVLLSIGIFEYFKKQKLEIKKTNHLFDITLSLFILLFTLFRAFFTYSIDNQFVFFVFPLLLISLIVFNFSLKNLLLYSKSLFISFYSQSKNYYIYHFQFY